MRDINTLHPEVKAMALELKARAQTECRLRIVITECLRTAEEQTALYAQGRMALTEVNRLRKIAGMPPITELQNRRTVTKAKTVADSFHGYGLAFDIAVVSPDGKQIDWTDKSDWNEDGINDWLEVGRLATKMGIDWGGNWTSFPDTPHYQCTFGHTIAELKAMPGVIAGKTIKFEGE